MASATVKHLDTGDSTGILRTDRRKWYPIPQEYDELFKDDTPFLSLSMRNKKTGLSDPVFKMFQYENTFFRRYMYNNGSTVTIAAASSGAAAESSAVTIDNVTGFGSTSTIDASFVHKVFEVWDSTLTTLRGRAILTDDTSTTTAKFKNLGTTAIATVDNDVFVLITNAQEDGAEAPDAYSSELAVVWNQCQQFKTPVQLEGEILYASLRGENNELKRLQAEKYKEHRVEIEGAFLKGESPAGTNLGAADTFTDIYALTGDTGKVVRTTYGILPALNAYGTSTTTSDYQNLFSITEGSYKYENFVDDTEKIFQYDPPGDTLYAITGPTANSYWSKLLYARSSKDNWVVQLSDKRKDSFGFNIRLLETPNGVLKLRPSKALKYEYKKYMVIPDDRHLAFYEYRPTKFMTDIKKDNAYDGRKDLYWSDAGIGIRHIKSHARMVIS